MENQSQHLTMTQRNELLKLLQIFEELLDGKLGTWKTDSVYYKIKEDVKSISSQTYPVPKVHEEIFQKGAECLFLLVIIKVANDSG